MELPQIEDRILEVSEIASTIAVTLENAKKELVDAQAEARATRILGDIERFIKGITEEAVKSQTIEERLSIVANGLAKISEFAKAEPVRLRDRVVAVTERIAVLESTTSFLSGRKDTYTGKVEAIKRVVEGTGDPRHPEKISTVREADRIKKQRKTDS